MKIDISDFKTKDFITFGISVFTLIVSISSLCVSCSGQNYVEATYEGNQKVIIYSENVKNVPNVVKLSAIGDKKRIISVDVYYPRKFRSVEDYVDSSGFFTPDAELNTVIAGILPRGTKAGELSVRIPVRLLTKYAADGDSFIDNSIYFLTYKCTVTKDRDEKYKVEVYDVRFDFASRIPSGVFYMLTSYLFGEDEYVDINKMYETGGYWSSVGFVGSI